MRVHKAQFVLFTPFVIGLLLQLLGFLYLRELGAIRTPRLGSLFLCLLSAYASPCGVIFGGVFATRKDKKREHTVSRGPFYIGLVLCIIWNALLVAFTSVFVFSEEGDPEAFCAQFIQISSASGFLVAAALTNFFLQPPSPR